MVFALNSSLHSYLILAYSDDDQVSTDVATAPKLPTVHDSEIVSPLCAVIGAVTADQFGPGGDTIGRGQSTRMILTACLLRLLLLPAIGMAAAVFLPVSQPLRQVMVIMAAMPAGTYFAGWVR